MALIVKNAVRELVKGKFNVSEEYLQSLDKEVEAIIRKASARAEGNGRCTLKARDA